VGARVRSSVVVGARAIQSAVVPPVSAETDTYERRRDHTAAASRL